MLQLQNKYKVKHNTILQEILLKTTPIENKQFVLNFVQNDPYEEYIIRNESCLRRTIWTTNNSFNNACMIILIIRLAVNIF